MNPLLDYRFWGALALALLLVYVVLSIGRPKAPKEGVTSKVINSKEEFEKLLRNNKPRTEENVRHIAFGVDSDGEVHGTFETPEDYQQALLTLREERMKVLNDPAKLAILTRAVQILMFRMKNINEQHLDFKIFSMQKFFESAYGEQSGRSHIEKRVELAGFQRLVEGLPEDASPTTWWWRYHGSTIREMNRRGMIVDVNWLVDENEYTPMTKADVLDLLNSYQHKA